MNFSTRSCTSPTLSVLPLDSAGHTSACQRVWAAHAISRIALIVLLNSEAGSPRPATLVTRDVAPRQNCRRFPTLAQAAGDHLMLKRIPPGVERFEGRTLRTPIYATTHEVLRGNLALPRRKTLPWT